jgi:hypothetical protein
VAASLQYIPKAVHCRVSFAVRPASKTQILPGMHCFQFQLWLRPYNIYQRQFIAEFLLPCVPNPRYRFCLGCTVLNFSCGCIPIIYTEGSSGQGFFGCASCIEDTDFARDVLFSAVAHCFTNMCVPTIPKAVHHIIPKAVPCRVSFAVCPASKTQILPGTYCFQLWLIVLHLSASQDSLHSISNESLPVYHEALGCTVFPVSYQFSQISLRMLAICYCCLQVIIYWKI